MMMEVSAKEIGELIGEVRAIQKTLSEVKASVDLLRENYITRKEYERRHAELIEIVHKNAMTNERRFERVNERLNDDDAKIKELGLEDAKFGLRAKFTDHLGSAILGAALTFLVVLITHFLHLI